jgi:hypothetical protein
VLTDNDLRAVVNAVRTVQGAVTDIVDPFDTPAAGVPHVTQESGYGHGV